MVGEARRKHANSASKSRVKRALRAVGQDEPGQMIVTDPNDLPLAMWKVVGQARKEDPATGQMFISTVLRAVASDGSPLMMPKLAGGSGPIQIIAEPHDVIQGIMTASGWVYRM